MMRLTKDNVLDALRHVNLNALLHDAGVEITPQGNLEPITLQMFDRWEVTLLRKHQFMGGVWEAGERHLTHFPPRGGSVEVMTGEGSNTTTVEVAEDESNLNRVLVVQTKGACPQRLIVTIEDK